MNKVQVSIDKFDKEIVWMLVKKNGHPSHLSTMLTRDEAKQLLVGLQAMFKEKNV